MMNKTKREYKINVGIREYFALVCIETTSNDQRSEARVQNKRGNQRVFCVGVYRPNDPSINEAKREYKINMEIIGYFPFLCVGTTH